MATPTQCYAQVRGSVIRATRLDSCGHPDPGQSAVVVSKRISTITVNELTDDGTNIRERNFAGELQIVDDAYTETLGWTVDAELCGVDPALVSLLTKQPVVLNAAGEVVGFDATTHIDLDSFGFALEVWSKIAGAACDASGRRKWGYTPFGFLKGGRISGFSFENGAVKFSISGARTIDGSVWGVGPFDVDRNGAGTPVPMLTPLTATTHFRNTLVTLDPPVASCGAFALAAGSF